MEEEGLSALGGAARKAPSGQIAVAWQLGLRSAAYCSGLERGLVGFLFVEG